MEKLSEYSFILFLLIIISCASNPRPGIDTNEIEKLDSLVAFKSFEVKVNWAKPLVTNSINSIANAGLLPWGSTANMIDITGSSSYLRITSDSVMANLPYYGERQLGGTYNSINNNVSFNGLPKDFKITKNEKNKFYKIDFTISDGTEIYDINLRLYPNLISFINVVSSHRTTISYKGRTHLFQNE